MAVSKIQTGLRLEEDTWKKIELIIEECINQFERNNGSIPLDDLQSD